MEGTLDSENSLWVAGARVRVEMSSALWGLGADHRISHCSQIEEASPGVCMWG